MMASPVFTIAIAIVMGRIRANETGLRELDVLREVHQVECEHTDPRLVVVTLHQMGNSTRAASGSTLKNDCSGNITFFTCQFAGSTIKVKAIISDLTEGEVRNFTCEANTMSGSVPTRHDLGWVTLTKLGNVSPVSSLSRPEGQSTTTILQSKTSPTSSVSSTAEIVGTVVAVIALSVAVTTTVVLWRKREKGSDVQVTTSADDAVSYTEVNVREITLVTNSGQPQISNEENPQSAVYENAEGLPDKTYDTTCPPCEEHSYSGLQVRTTGSANTATG